MGQSAVLEHDSAVHMREDADVRPVESAEYDDLFDFEVTDALRDLAQIDGLGDQIRSGDIPNTLLADLAQGWNVLDEEESDE